MLEILRQREHLLIRCDMQRRDLAMFAQQSAGAFKAVDRVLGVVNFFRKYPMMLAVTAAGLAVIQRRSLWGWVRRGFLIWRGYRALRSSGFSLRA